VTTIIWPQLTPELLTELASASLQNAGELLAEASLLLANGRFARAYFLSVASIEESGKARLAFDSQSRNLANPAVCSTLRRYLENHPRKIQYALGSWLMDNEADARRVLEMVSRLMVELQRGREPSMYSDLRTSPDKAQRPSDVVRPSAAADCVRLAHDCLSRARRHIATNRPPTITPSDDRLFTLRSTQLNAIVKSPDFWWYFLDRLERGEKNWADTVLQYEAHYRSKGLSFRKPPAAS
jgi:AbiV family abortive infection protein